MELELELDEDCGRVGDFNSEISSDVGLGEIYGELEREVIPSPVNIPQGSKSRNFKLPEKPKRILRLEN